jgi:hypothetical protein
MPILVWNGLVTRMRRTGAESLKMKLAWTPTTVHSSDDERHSTAAEEEPA